MSEQPHRQVGIEPPEAETASRSGPEIYCEDTVKATIDIVGGKWTMLILWELLGSEQRYNELQRLVTGISQKVLSSELKTLVAEGLVDREVAATSPPQVTYRITEAGRSLDDVFVALDRWGLSRDRSSPARGTQGSPRAD